jgi:hypothetical protein
MGGLNTSTSRSLKAFMKSRLQSIKNLGFGTLLLGSIGICAAQKVPQPVRVWSVGPLTNGASVMGISFGNGGTTVTGPHVDSQTGSIFAATRSVVFAGDRIVFASRVGMRKVENAQVPAGVYQLLSLDRQTGEIRDSREFLAFNSLKVFATNDEHVIVSGRNVMRLTPDLKDAGSLEFGPRNSGDLENISPDGSALGNAKGPGFEMIDTHTLKVTELTAEPSVATSVNSRGFVTDNPYGYTDAVGRHAVNHAKCGGRPQFLTDHLILETGCKSPVVVDIEGNLIKILPIKGGFSYAGVAQNGKRFALQRRDQA